MLAHLGLFAPILEKLASVMVKVAVDFLMAPWPTLYIPVPTDISSNFLLKIICSLTIFITFFCYKALGAKMLQLSSQLNSLTVVRNDNLNAPKSQNMELELNPGQTPLRTARLIGWERNNPLLIDEVAASPPGPKPLAAPQDSASKLPV
ncbi:hypothetical protein DSO57_1017270 [Entomophthora muscae]|uniref:Uncharacterized protein n=1 Tax=Entomophthora muscae TaxID=34485 RepID=A0ACC2UE38_9FUNG|nr:hypothetical protein DSO57_1017270 [Entomophthora muscae]